MWFKRWLYARGLRPNVGSIFHSPSLNFIYGYPALEVTYKKQKVDFDYEYADVLEDASALANLSALVTNPPDHKHSYKLIGGYYVAYDIDVEPFFVCQRCLHTRIYDRGALWPQ